VTIDLYIGAAKTDVSAGATPVHADSLSVPSPDGAWRLTVGGGNVLTVTPAHSGTVAGTIDVGTAAARVPLAPFIQNAPVKSIAFLDGGRHLMIRQDTDAWLLDFAAARAYGGLMARLATCSRTISPESYKVKRETNRVETAGAQLAVSSEGFGVEDEYDADIFSLMPDPDATAPAFFAVRAEQFIANQAWGYAAAMMEEAARLQEYDSRAPRINPLLLARCQLLAGRDQKARATCRDALRSLLSRPVVYDLATGSYRSPPNISDTDNRMIRYHLQGLLFAK
jgi:hypothetical protein